MRPSATQLTQPRRALMDPVLSCRLTGDRGWSPARFQDLFADAILRLLLPGTGQPATANQSPEVT
jgi:hypothetical protein